MPTITIGVTGKKINSTSRVMTDSVQLSCKLKAACSMQVPVFVVQGLTKGKLYNFCEFEGRYYWIDDIVYKTNLIQEVHCHIDTLATFVNDIKDTHALVIYGDKGNKSNVDDGRFSPELILDKFTGEVDMFGIRPSKEGFVAMTFTQTSSVDFLTNNTAVTGCGIHTAMLSMADFKTCIADLNNFNVTGGIIEIAQAFARAFAGGTLLDNILRVIWLPFDLSDLVAKLGIGTSGYRYGLMLGGVLAANTSWYEIDQSCILIHDFNFDFTSIMTSATWNNKLLYHDRFVSLQITNAGGYLNVPLSRFIDDQHLLGRTTFCISDGSWSMKLFFNQAAEDTLVANSGSVGVNLMGTVYMGPTPSNVIADNLARFEVAAVAMGVGSVIAGAATSGTAAGQAATQASTEGIHILSDSPATTLNKLGHISIGESLSAQQMGTIAIGTGIMGALPQSGRNVNSTSGTFGGAASSIFLNTNPGTLTYELVIWAPEIIIVDPVTGYDTYCTLYGYPCHKYLKLGNVKGFIMCAGANIESAPGATEANLASINNFLNNGFVLEA